MIGIRATWLTSRFSPARNSFEHEEVMEVCGFLNDTALNHLGCFAAQVQFRGSPQEGAGAKPLLCALAPRTISLSSQEPMEIWPSWSLPSLP